MPLAALFFHPTSSVAFALPRPDTLSPPPLWSCSYGDVFPISYMRFKTIVSTRLCLFGRQGQADSMPPSLLSSLQHRAPSATNLEHPEACMNIQCVEYIGMLVPLRLRQDLAEVTVIHGAGEVPISPRLSRKISSM